MSLVLLVLEAVGLHKLAVPFDVFGGKNLRQTERKLEGRKLSNSDHQTTYTAHVRGRRASGMWAALTLEKIVEGFAMVFVITNDHGLDLLERYGDLVFMDATHGTNKV